MNDLWVAVIHDVKNQLAELALRLDKRGDAQQEMLIAMSAARRLSEMLLLYRHDEKSLNINADSVDAADFLEILAAEYRELFPGVSIDIDTTQAPPFAFFDDALVRMALANAMHNACRVASSRVGLAAYTQDQMLVLQVVDDGPGFPEDQLKKCGSEPSAVSGRGTGLGLYMGRKIAESHVLENRCGRIELSNDGGAVFRMMLP